MNLIAILIAALIPMVIGFIWYHPKVFGTLWMKETGMTEEKARQGNQILKFVLTFLFSFMLAFVLNSLAVHDSFIDGATYYKTNKTNIPEPGTELAQWKEYYYTNLAADNHTAKHGAFHAFMLVGLFIVLPIFATNSIFEGKSWKYVAVNTSYWMLSLIIMGAIIASWR